MGDKIVNFNMNIIFDDHFRMLDDKCMNIIEDNFYMVYSDVLSDIILIDLWDGLRNIERELEI